MAALGVLGVLLPQFPDAYDYLKENGNNQEIVRYVVVRHGETSSNRDKKVGGQTVDVDLTDEGRSQVQRLGQQLAEVGLCVKGLFSSSLIRATETVRICTEEMKMEHMAIKIDNRVIEKHFGPDEGVDEADYKETIALANTATKGCNWEEKFAYQVYPEVESLQTVYKRGREFLVQDLPNGNYLVKTHKVVKKALLMGLLKEAGREVDYRSFDLQNCSVFVIEVPRGEAPRLVAATGLT